MRNTADNVIIFVNLFWVFCAWSIVLLGVNQWCGWWRAEVEAGLGADTRSRIVPARSGLRSVSWGRPMGRNATRPLRTICAQKKTKYRNSNRKNVNSPSGSHHLNKWGLLQSYCHPLGKLLHLSENAYMIRRYIHRKGENVGNDNDNMRITECGQWMTSAEAGKSPVDDPFSSSSLYLSS